MRHPTDKPVALLKYLIEKSTLPDEIVLDMFAGVGSTCVAAKHSERLYTGIEMQPEFFHIAEEQLAA